MEGGAVEGTPSKGYQTVGGRVMSVRHAIARASASWTDHWRRASTSSGCEARRLRRSASMRAMRRTATGVAHAGRPSLRGTCSTRTVVSALADSTAAESWACACPLSPGTGAGVLCG